MFCFTELAPTPDKLPIAVQMITGVHFPKINGYQTFVYVFNNTYHWSSIKANTSAVAEKSVRFSIGTKEQS
jgi:hypothetical protein